jgi:hypothetical protein
MALGPAVGTLGGGLLIAQIGWRNVFILFGRGLVVRSLDSGRRQ